MLTIDGTGFGNESVVSICDSICEHGENIENTAATYSQIICRVPGKKLLRLILVYFSVIVSFAEIIRQNVYSETITNL